jgi:hypothetical protein
MKTQPAQPRTEPRSRVWPLLDIISKKLQAITVVLDRKWRLEQEGRRSTEADDFEDEVIMIMNSVESLFLPSGSQNARPKGIQTTYG